MSASPLRKNWIERALDQPIIVAAACLISYGAVCAGIWYALKAIAYLRSAP